MQAQLGKKYAAGNEQADALTDENRRLREQLERLTSDQDHYRVLIAASIDKSIEVFADPQVRVQVVCLPETRTPVELERATGWALAKLPREFQGMMHDIGIRAETFTLVCMDRVHWNYYRDRMDAWHYIEQLGEAVEEITSKPEVEPACEVSTPW